MIHDNLRRIAPLLCLAGLSALLPASPAVAEEWSVLGSRYQAMGGAGVAIVNDGYATHWNPGALALASQTTEFEIPFDMAMIAAGDILKDVDEIAELIKTNGLANVLTGMQTGQSLTATELRDILALASRLTDLATAGEGLMGTPQAGLTFRQGRFALNTSFGASFGIDPGFDPINLALSTAGSAAAQISNAVGAGADRSAQFANASSQSLADTLSALYAAWSQNQAEEIVFQAEQAGLDTSGLGIQTLIRDIAGSTADLLTSDLSLNTSGATIESLLTQEVGLSYGHPLFGGRIGVGANVRYVRGTTYRQFIQYDDIKSTDDLIDDLRDRRNREVSHNLGVDLGLIVQATDWLRVGLVGRNLNSPEFDSSGTSNLEQEAQVRAGVALQPVPYWLVAVDLDVTENESATVRGFRSRMLSVGTEIMIPMGGAALALRAGAYTNLAADSGDTLTVTAGLGLRLWNLHLDVAAGASPHWSEIEASGSDLPQHLNLSGALKWVSEF